MASPVARRTSMQSPAMTVNDSASQTAAVSSASNATSPSFAGAPSGKAVQLSEPLIDEVAQRLEYFSL